MRKNNKGFTLVEVTIILLVLVILSGILLPTIERFIDLARYVKVKEDLGMIAAIIELWKVDNCSRFFKVCGSSSNQSADNRVDLLVSVVSPGIGNPDTGAFAPVGGDPNWLYPYTGVTGPATFNVDTMENQLVTNTPMGQAGWAYPSPGVSPASCGWRGAYISAPLGADPWGTRYMANVAFLGPPGGRTLGASNPPGFNQYDVFVLSAGPDKSVQTPFLVDGAIALGDDLMALVSGGF
jgi:type II secretory pathway pseudopilin PulG